jgi:hypothetical protein
VQQDGYVLAVGLNAQQHRKFMPRPKPPEALKARHLRMSDTEWAKFKELGGAEWLRKYVNSKAKFPAKYYEVFQKPEEAAKPRAPKTFEPRRVEGVVAFCET